MVNIDTVYQKVLNFASKEQRGYITPQEFNLFANQAQKEIFEQYFYDVNQFRRVPGNDTTYADVDDILEEKLQIFEVIEDQNDITGFEDDGNTTNKILPDRIYRVSRVEFNQINCEIMSTKDFRSINQAGPLLLPTNARPVVNIRNNIMRCSAEGGNLVVPTAILYFRAPANPTWGYFVISGKALYNSNQSVNFELHPAEEVELVYKILKYAGVSMQRDDIMKVGQGLDSQQQQQEKQ